MEKAFVIAEKGSLFRQIMSVYKKNKDKFDFSLEGVAQYGHIFGFQSPAEMDEDMKRWEFDLFPWLPDTIPYKLTPVFGPMDSKEIFSKIKEAVNGDYDFIIHAGDPDQEGELLIRESLMLAGNKKPVKRLWVNATTDDDLLNAMLTMLPGDTPKYERWGQAALARARADYLIGMNLSPVVSLKCGETANVGRLKTFIVALIAAREEAIRNFVESSNYGVVADYGDFTGESKETFETEDKAKDFSRGLSTTGKVLSYVKKKEKTKPPQFFKLSTLQIHAGKYGLTPAEVQDICQKLYDNGYLSYPRTSCEYVGEGIHIDQILAVCGEYDKLAHFTGSITKDVKDQVLSDSRYVNQAAVESAGHQALTPTGKPVPLDSLTEKETLVFYLVCERIVSAFLPPLVEEKTHVEVDIDGNTFVSNGKILLNKGFTELVGYNGENKEIPAVKEGAILTIHEYTLAEHKAKKPSRITTGELVDLLDNPVKLLEDDRLKKMAKGGIVNASIGTPATRSPTIKQLIDLGYIEEQKNKKSVVLIPTEKGMRYAVNLSECTLCMADTTAMWEEKLNQIREGEFTREAFEKEIRDYIVDEVAFLKSKEMNVYGGFCECYFCGGNVIEKQKNYTCISCHATLWKKNRYFEAIGKKVTSAVAKDIMSTGKTHLTGLKSKKGTMYETDVVAILGEKGLSFSMEFNDKKTPLCECPLCGKTIYAGSKGYFCEDSDCAAHIYKNDYFFAAVGKVVDEDLAKTLFEDGVAYVTGLKSKKGKTFSANVYVEFGGKNPHYQYGFD